MASCCSPTVAAAAADRDLIGAVVSRGGRPDLADPDLERVQAPTLLIVGGEDDVVIELNRYAHKKLKTEKELLIIPGASHLFEEPGTLEEVARLATQWFKQHLGKRRHDMIKLNKPVGHDAHNHIILPEEIETP